MLGSGELGVLALGLCLCLGCGGRDESTKTATVGQTGAQLLEVVLSSAGKLCEQLAQCYPDLQAPSATSCDAPASDGGKIQYQSPNIDPNVESHLAECFGEYPDQAELVQWVNCVVEVDRISAECFSSCPADSEACLIAGSTAGRQCDRSDIEEWLRPCYGPK